MPDKELQNPDLMGAIEQIRRELDASLGVPSEERDLRLQDLILALEVGMEEMETAEAELRAQNEELKEARHLIELERSRYQALFDLAPDGYLVTDRHGVISDANQAAQEMLGSRFQDLMGKPVAVVVEEDDRRAFRQHLLAALASETKTSWLSKFSRDARQPGITVAVSMRPTAADSETVHWLLRDVTADVAAQDAVQRSEEELQQILHTAGDAIITVSSDLYITRVNPAAVSMFGYDAAAFANMPLSALLPERFRDGHEEHVEEFAGAPETSRTMGARAEVLGLRRDGSEFAAEITIAKLANANGIFGYTAVVRDVTEQRMASEAIRFEQERLSKLVESCPAGVIMVGSAGEVLTLNPEARRIYRDDRSGATDLQGYEQSVTFRHPDGRSFPPEESPLQRALNEGRTVHAEEVHFEFEDGSVTPTQIHATPLRTAEGAPVGALAIIVDLTPIAELERLRNEFLAMVSHELKTPLTSIKGSASMALGSRRELAPEEVTELFSIVNDESDRLRELVDNLLDMTRIESGTLPVVPMNTNLSSLLQEASDTFTRTTGRTFSFPSGPQPNVEADPLRIGQVLTNLLTNAAKYSPANTPIEVAVDSDGDHATITVRDQGNGFAPEQAAHLFAKFSQLPDEGGRFGVGSGLGLAICRGIVEAHGGRIWAESPGPSLGSTFSFTLPQAAAARVEAVDERARLVGDTIEPSRPNARRMILAIDDDPHVLRAVQRVLANGELGCMTTQDAAEGIRLAGSERPDLVLVDLNLVGADGFDVLARIREFSGVPVIFLSARADTELAAKALHAGADDYVTKPFSPSELLARIETALRKRGAPSRSGVRGHADDAQVIAPYRREGVEIDFVNRRLSVGGVDVVLSATEYRLLLELASNAGRLMSHDQLLNAVWGPDREGNPSLVRSFVRNLRDKLGDDARKPRFITTESGVGYRMARSSD